ncbi:DUF1678 family protein [Methanopyrus kandleri]|uniref:Uncharacterized protein specific for M.kandleri, MK-1 family n=2 Tax=Methanopyrus kandleri TaxID=2320 RepID=Q8TWT7_METKA|nr:DUF1678 family protein [Methanopyrus kandleri]AAM02158.1 Uncharacterized protein specific for M.kandleri, MK-1 family [Methanopyrus kandleri AV19]HII69823.1 DUF1678 family protein [Methanopyrus kandleri]
MITSHAHVPIPSDPVERIRALRVLREAYRRGKKPSLEVTYRTMGGSTCGPYYVARWRRDSRFKHGRTLYLGKPENESVRFVEWLVSLDRGEVLELARHLMRNLRSVLKTLLAEVSDLPYKRARRVLARGLSLAFNARPSESPRIRDLLEELPDRLESFLIRTLGGWPAHYSIHLRKVIRSRKRSLDGRYEIPDVGLELEHWRLRHGT